MYERFTDRARKVMQLAHQEAQRFNHEYVGTEHLLLGMIKEGSGVAANILRNMDLDLGKVRRAVEELVQAGPESNFITMGKLPHTPATKKVIEHTIDVARELDDNYVGTEHMLLGLMRQKEGVAAQVLNKFGVTEVEVLVEAANLLGKPKVLMARHEKMMQEKESAVADQNFQLAQEIRDQMNVIKAEAEKIKAEQKPNGTPNPAQEKLQRITCAVLEYQTGQVSAEAALTAIKRLV